MPPRRPRFHLVDIVLITVLVGLVLGFFQWMGTPRPLGSGDWTALVFSLAIGVWFAIWKASRARRVGPVCADCGRRFAPTEKPVGPVVCPNCRWKGFSPAKARRERIKVFAVLAYLLVIGTFLVGVMLYDPGGVPFGPGDWFTLPLKAAGLTFGGIGLLVAAFVVLVVARNLLTRGERHKLARARKVTRTEGEEATLGPIAVWYSGPDDPSAMVANAVEAVRHRFDAFAGEPVEARPPLRLLVFHERQALVDFHREPLSDLWNLDALFTPRVASMTTEVVPYRLGDPARTVRSLAAYHAMVAYKGALPPFWLQQGVAAAVAAGGDGSDRLNRRMLAAIGRGSALGVDLFALAPWALMQLLRGWHAHAKFARWEQIQGQSRSLVEYLNGPEAPEDRRRPFRAFFKELRPGPNAEALFRLHFGHGFDGLIASWRDWVRERAPGAHGPPPAAVEETLASRIIPLATDRSAKFRDRVHAIREMGRTGFTRGADALIALLADPGDVPRDEVVWALESISGLPLGDDHVRWSAWWDGLPSQAEALATEARGPA